MRYNFASHPLLYSRQWDVIELSLYSRGGGGVLSQTLDPAISSTPEDKIQ